MPTHVIAVNGAAADPSTGASVVDLKFYQRKTILTDIQIKKLWENPVELIEAPGDNKIIIPFGCFVASNLVTAYSGLSDGDGIFFTYDGGDLYNLIEGFWKADADGINTLGNILTQDGVKSFHIAHEGKSFSGSSGWFRPIQIGFIQDGEITGAINKPFLVKGFYFNGDYAGGGPENTLEITVFYSIVEL